MPSPLPDPNGRSSTPVPDGKQASGDTVDPSDDSVGGTRTEGADYRPEVVQRLNIPAQIGGYRVLSILGEGGMGRVYLAEDARLNRKVALKVMRAELAENAQAVERFLREARAVAAIEHDHVIGIFQVGEDNGVPFLAMPLLKGETLDARLKRDRVLPVPEAVRLARETAEGLATAHEAGLIHRDIKPANLWLEPKGQAGAARIKILDFGLAQTGGAHLTASGTVMGTPAYMAPEQARGQKVDHRCDLFSLGAVIYQLLTGNRPFIGEDAMAVLSSLALDTPTEPHRLNGAVPPALSHLVMRLIAKAPAQRPQSTRGVAAELLEIEREFTAPPVAMAVPVVMPIMPQPEANPWSEIDDDGTVLADPVPTTPFHESRPPEDSARAQRKPGSMAVLWAVLGIAVLGGAIYLFTKSRERPVPTQPEVVEKVDPPKGKDDPEKARIAEAEAALPALEAKFKEAGVTFESFAKDVQSFKAKWGGTPAAIRAAEMLIKLQSPLDKLDPAKIPEDAKAAWKASGFDGRDVVGVLGQHQRRHWGGIGRIAASPDGKLYASGGADKLIYIWHAETLSLVRTIEGHTAGINCLAFSPDGSLLASGGANPENQIRVWDVKSWIEKQPVPHHQPHSVNFSQDNQLLLVSGQSFVQVWNLKTGKQVDRLPIPKAPANFAAGQSLFSKDCKQVYAGLLDASIRAWDWETGKETKRYDKVYRAWLSANPKMSIALPENSTARVLDLETGMEGQQIGVISDYAAISSDGRLLATTGVPDAENIHLFDLEQNKKRWSIAKPSGGNYNLSFTIDNRRLLAGTSEGVIQVLDVETGKEVQPLSGPIGSVNAVSITPDGTKLVSGGPGVWVWDVKSGQLLKRLTRNQGSNHVFALSPDGRRVATGEGYEGIRLWDLEAGEELLRFKGPIGLVNSLAFSPDGTRVLSGGEQNGVVLWDAAKGTPLQTIEVKLNGAVARPVAFSPSGLVGVAGDNADSIHWFEVKSGRELKQTRAKFQNVVDYAGFSSDGARTFAGSNSKCKLWTLAQEQVGEFDARFAAFSPENRLIAAADGNEVKLLEAVSLKPLREWQLPGPVHAVAFGADGRHLATANGNGTVYILRIPIDARAPKDPPSKALSEWTAPEKLPAPINGEFRNGGPCLSADGLDLVFHSDRPGGHGNYDLWVARRPALDKPFAEPTNLGPKINSTGREQDPFVSRDGMVLLFASSRGQNADTTDLWMCSRPRADAEWGEPASLGPTVNSAERDWGPCLSADGLTLLFHSDRSGGQGSNDIWMCRRESTKDAFAAAVNLGPIINTAAEEGGPELSADGLILYFHRTGRAGKLDLMKATRPAVDKPFGTPISLGDGVNGDADDMSPALDRAGQALVFARRLDSQTGNDLWITRRSEVPKALTPDEAKKQQEAAAKELGVQVEIENSIGMKLKLIPAGRFVLGAPENEPGYNSTQGPQRVITLTRPYYYGAYEVTQSQFEALISRNPSAFTKDKGGGPDFPVESITWDDAVEFCKKLSDQPKERAEGRTYRLPTTAEWEYACRAGSQTTFFFGDQPTRLGEYAWFKDNSDDKPHPVGKKKANPWGMFDVIGNVTEWCSDQLAVSYSDYDAIDPKGPDMSVNGNRVRRGGGYNTDSIYSKCANRGGRQPSERLPDLGFRVVCEIAPPKK